MTTRISSSLANAGRSSLGHGARLRAGRRTPTGQLVAGLQRAALEAAERAERVGRAAAEHHRARRCRRRRRCRRGRRRCRKSNDEHRRRPPRRTTSHSGRSSPSTFGVISAPVTATTASLGERQLRAHERALQRRGALVVADQQVGRDQREPVQRARRRDADVVVARAAAVLDGRGQAGLDAPQSPRSTSSSRAL